MRVRINAHEGLCLSQHPGYSFHCGTAVTNSLNYSESGV